MANGAGRIVKTARNSRGEVILHPRIVLIWKGVSYLKDDQNQRKAVVIEMVTLERYMDQLEDLLDGLIAESRKMMRKFL